MRPRAKSTEKILSETLRLFDKAAASEAESAQAQTLTYLEAHAGEVVPERVRDAAAVRPARTSHWRAALTVAAGIVLAFLLSPQLFRSAPAVLEDTAGSRNIEFGEVVRANDIASSTLVLEDESRVEMRANSELSLERADDGVRIRLRNGDIIVNAAKQHGHLYVQTKDVTVSVIGTVFLVKAEVTGSRVAVIEGEVHVKQGSTETKLRPGEEMTTSPKMETIPLKDEVAWSSQAVAHVASLEQAATTQAVKELRFDVASIRPSGPAAPAPPGARGGGGDANSHPTKAGCVPDSAGYSYQLDPRRLAIYRFTLLQLVVLAYPVEGVPEINPFMFCQQASRTGRISGGPEWIRTEMWDLQAGIAEGAIPPTSRFIFPGRPSDLPFWKITDSKVQQMLQTLLAERFQLVIRKETRDMPVYLLKVGKNGPKFNGVGENVKRMFFLDSDGKVKPASELPPPSEGGFSIIANRFLDVRNASMAEWADNLFGLDNRPVLDRTGMTGRYDFHYYRDTATTGDVLLEGSSLNREAVQAMGFELEEARAPYEVWVIDRVEKPSEN